jgi:predicted TPR repeat methyltransferase
MNPQALLLRNPFVALAPAEDGYLAYDIQSSQLHRLNAAAALIIELCDATQTAGDIIAQVSTFIPGDGAEAGCQAWIEGAIDGGLLKEIVAGQPAPGAPPLEAFTAAAKKLRKQGQVLAAFVCQHYAVYEMADPDVDHWDALGVLAHIIGRREDARDAYERYLELAPDDAEVRHLLVSLRDEAPPPRASDDAITKLYERFAEFYETNMVTDLEYQGPERLAEALQSELGDASDARFDVLELGVGTGLAGRHLRPRAKRLVGIDLSPEMLERARKTGFYDALDVAEITAWLARPEMTSYDLIVACDTLIYFGDLRQVLVPAAKHLRSGGTMAFTVERAGEGTFKLTDSGRYTHSEQHIRETAAAAGLRVASVSEARIRWEYGREVMGLVTVLRSDS